MGLHLHRADRTDLLADGLAEVLSVPLADPFEEEVVVVPAKGVERWLAQRLSHRLGRSSGQSDGICAGVRFLNPWALISMLLGTDASDPWEAERLAWPLLETIDDSLGEPWAETLTQHLSSPAPAEDEARQARRYAVARRLAGLISGYAQQRPSLLAAWREGRDTDGVLGDEQPLPDDLLWQPELYRRLLARLAIPGPDQRLAATVARIDSNDLAGLHLPGRLSFFGHTRIAACDVQLLRALARVRDVHLWLPQSSAELWDRLASPTTPVLPRADDDSVLAADNRLLASLGRDARELQRTLSAVPSASESVIDAQGAPAPGLLGWLQSDLRANHQPTADDRAARQIELGDDSLRVHACHGPSRQVAVLREVLVGLLQDDPTLQPRDIVVMCPDVETYAPLISAAFGLAVDDDPETFHPGHRLRVQLADRSLASTNPLLQLAVTLAELTGGRVRATEVLDLLALDPVRRRFRLSDDDLARISGWVSDAGVRWGLDRPSRRDFAMDGFSHNTWRAGLDRILLGVAMSGDDYRAVRHALPLDDVSSSDIELAGRLAEIVDRLTLTLTALSNARTVTQWMQGLTDGVHGLGEVATKDAWQVAQFDRELTRITQAGAGHDTALGVTDVRALLQSQLGGRPTRANFRTGTLTVCTMVPMRSVPHRVICLLGLDDGVFPRIRSLDGDDVLARRPLTGERDLRSEDRQLLLDAVLAATDKLVVCYSGANESSGATKPPAVPLGELISAARATASGPGLEHLVVRHPLQSYDVRNLSVGGVVPGRSFSFDAAALAGAQAGAQVREPVPPLLESPLTAPRQSITLDDLKQFFYHPVRWFLRERLELATPLEAKDVDNAIPVELDSLAKWEIGDRLLREVLAGTSPAAVMFAEQLRGSLPPRVLGQAALEEVTKQAQELYRQAAQLRAGTPNTRDLVIDLAALGVGGDSGEARILSGTVSSLFANKVVTAGYSRLGAKQRLSGWIDVLALSVAYPDEGWWSHAIGKGPGGASLATIGPLDHRAKEWLADLIRLFDEGTTRPLPLPAKTALAYAQAAHEASLGSRKKPYDSALREWRTDPFDAGGFDKEDVDVWHELAFGHAAALDELIQLGLPTLAERLWLPLLTDAERMGPL